MILYWEVSWERPGQGDCKGLDGWTGYWFLGTCISVPRAWASGTARLHTHTPNCEASGLKAVRRGAAALGSRRSTAGPEARPLSHSTPDSTATQAGPKFIYANEQHEDRALGSRPCASTEGFPGISFRFSKPHGVRLIGSYSTAPRAWGAALCSLAPSTHLGTWAGRYSVQAPVPVKLSGQRCLQSHQPLRSAGGSSIRRTGEGSVNFGECMRSGG